MDEKKPNSLEDQKIKEYLNSTTATKSQATDFSKSTISSELRELLDQRKAHRNVLLTWLLKLTTASFILLAVLVIFQAIARLYDKTYTVFTGMEFQILAVSVFGQIIGVVYIISKSLWDDKDYIGKI